MGIGGSKETNGMLIGTYGTKLGHVDGKGDGIAFAQLVFSNSSLKIESLDALCTWRDRASKQCPLNPTYLCKHPFLPVVYASDENEEEGFVWAIRLGNPGEVISKISSRGTSCAHVAIHESGRFVLAANYMGGPVVVYEVDTTNGKIIQCTYVETDALGRPDRLPGPNERRQQIPHPHMIFLRRNEVFVPNLGLDVVHHFALDDSGKLDLKNDWEIPRGLGPRHMEMLPNTDTAFVLCEMRSVVCVVDQENGSLTQTISTITGIEDGLSDDRKWGASAIQLHPSCRFLYTSNRSLEGRNGSVAAFRIKDDGKLSMIGTLDTNGLVPREMKLTPDGKILAVANQDSHEIRFFNVSQENGTLEIIRNAKLDVNSPAAILFL